MLFQIGYGVSHVRQQGSVNVTLLWPGPLDRRLLGTSLLLV